MKKFIIVALALFATACTDYREVPVSKLGKVIDSKGLSPETFEPGLRNIGWAWHTKKLVLLDTAVETIPLDLTIRLADNQELGVSLLVKTRLNTSKSNVVDSMFNMITPVKMDSHNYKIPLTLIYQKLGQDLVRRTMVEVITPNSLESFQKDRKQINDTIERTINERFKKTPLKLISATINKVTYPALYAKTADDIKRMEMDKELKQREEEAKRAKLIAEEETIIIDQRVRLAKAETIRLENVKTAKGLNPMLLEYRKMELEEKRIEVDMEFAKAAQVAGNKVIYYPMGQRPNYIDTRMGQTND